MNIVLFYQNCEENIRNKKTCNNECKNIALEMSKLDSCCPNSSLIKRFDCYLIFFDTLRQIFDGFTMTFWNRTERKIFFSILNRLDLIIRIKIYFNLKN